VVRAAALLGLLLALVLWSEFAPDLPGPVSDWWNVAILSLGVIPAMFALVWLALPLRRPGSQRVGVVALVLVAVAAVLTVADLEIAANYAKLAAATALGWWFLSFFEAPWWVLLVALFIVPVDLYSVARGPTKEITENQPQVFDALSVFMRIPGTDATAKLGLPDVLFFALFLGAAWRFRLRVPATWIAMTLSFGGTLALAIWLDEAGVAALPLLSAAFVLVNADLLWASIRGRRNVDADRPASV
jgi:hypothetical protein